MAVFGIAKDDQRDGTLQYDLSRYPVHTHASYGLKMFSTALQAVTRNLHTSSRDCIRSRLQIRPNRTTYTKSRNLRNAKVIPVVLIPLSSRCSTSSIPYLIHFPHPTPSCSYADRHDRRGRYTRALDPQSPAPKPLASPGMRPLSLHGAKFSTSPAPILSVSYPAGKEEDNVEATF